MATGTAQGYIGNPAAGPHFSLNNQIRGLYLRSAYNSGLKVGFVAEYTERVLIRERNIKESIFRRKVSSRKFPGLKRRRIFPHWEDVGPAWSAKKSGR
jgi:hypothetical protein